MLRKYLYGIFAFVLATGILVISFLRLSSLAFAFPNTPAPSAQPTNTVPTIDYQLVQPGNILPDSFLWPLKAIRDRIWYIFTNSHSERAQLALQFADKRIAAGQALCQKGDLELGVSTTIKAEMYMETAAAEEEAARREGIDTSALLDRLATAVLKHEEIIERDILPNASGKARPQIDKARENLNNIYRDTSETLKSMGKDYPKNPFEGH